MRTFKIRTSFSTSEYTLTADNVIRNQIGRAAMDDQVAEIAKNHHISDEIIKATADQRDREIRDFLKIDLEANIGKAVNTHFKKVLRAQR